MEVEIWLDKDEAVFIGEVRIVNFGRKHRPGWIRRGNPKGQGNLHLGFDAPKHIPIFRKELTDEDTDVA